MRDFDAGFAECINDIPGVAEPGNFREDNAADDGGESEVVIVALG